MQLQNTQYQLLKFNCRYEINASVAFMVDKSKYGFSIALITHNIYTLNYYNTAVKTTIRELCNYYQGAINFLLMFS